MICEGHGWIAHHTPVDLNRVTGQSGLAADNLLTEVPFEEASGRQRSFSPPQRRTGRAKPRIVDKFATVARCTIHPGFEQRDLGAPPTPHLALSEVDLHIPGAWRAAVAGI